MAGGATSRSSPPPLAIAIARARAIARAIAIAIAIAAPIKTVVDPNLHHLDVAVPHKEGVSREALESKRSNKCPVVQPQKVILHLRRPIGQESPLDARAHQPAAI